MESGVTVAWATGTIRIMESAPRPRIETATTILVSSELPVRTPLIP